MAARRDSRLFEPLSIANGGITLQHRIILAPLTRNRGIPLCRSTPNTPNRVWVPDDLVAEYYRQRATPGGLLISEGLHPSLEAGGTPGVPGLFKEEHVSGWRKVTNAVHEKGGYIYAQLWHAGRTAMPQMTGLPSVSASAVGFKSDEIYRYTSLPKKDFPPIELSVDHIKRTIEDYVHAANLALESGFDGVEIHGGNGYRGYSIATVKADLLTETFKISNVNGLLVPEQFLNSNINQRMDHYGGSPNHRCRFVIELIEALVGAIGQEKLAIRLSPFNLFNETYGEERLETWTFLCREIKRRWQLSYIHFIEPRYEQFISLEVKDKFLASWGLADVTLEPFREIMGDTPLVSAGGWNDSNSWGALETEKYDALAFGRWFISNPDLVERLRNGVQLNKYDRSRFYGPFEDRHVGYTDYPTLSQCLDLPEEPAPASAVL